MPDIVILNEATSTLDGQMQPKVMAGVAEECAGGDLVWMLQREPRPRI